MLPLCLTCGEPGGISPEITLKAWLQRQGLSPFYVMGDVDWLEHTMRKLALPVPLHRLSHPSETPSVFARALPVWPLAFPVMPRFGHSDAALAPAVISSIQQAVQHVQAGVAGAVVTNPIHKATLYNAGFSYDGHTEYLGGLAGGVPTVMMLACPGLRVVPQTIHVPLRTVPERLSVEALLTTARITLAALRDDFGIPKPRLAVAGLNPHAGEDGKIGTEERDILIPAITALRQEGWDISLPQAADTLFHEQARAGYDAVWCMYHDQALIPLKTLDFFGGVNITLGLPFVRTSPDHGTGLAIAGKGVARADSLIASLRMAAQIVSQRRSAFRAHAS